MADSHSALVALAQTRRSDPALVSLLAAGAARIRSQAQVEAEVLRQEANRLRREARRDLHSAKAEFEGAYQRLAVIRGFEINGELKTAALRAASSELAKSRRSLHEAAKNVEAAVSAARKLEARAEVVVRRAAARPEVTAFEALSIAPGHDGRGSGHANRSLGGRRCSRRPRHDTQAARHAPEGMQAPAYVRAEGSHGM